MIKPYYEAEGCTIYLGDCLDIMPTLEANSIDSIVTDPPYGLSFMGKDWDHGVPGSPFWIEALRVAKPGAFMLAFGGTRTFHRLAVAIEDAGWEIRDTIGWIYGQGFPKSHDISKAIDKVAGAERELGSENPNWRSSRSNIACPQGVLSARITAPAIDAARQWEGWGTALKPAWEPIIVARKPIEGTVANNVLRWGTGGINIDGCRVGTSQNDKNIRINPTKSNGLKSVFGIGDVNYGRGPATKGRWPANICHDGSDEVVGLFPNTGSGHSPKYSKANPFGGNNDSPHNEHYFNDSGSAARFFYCAKSSKSDRNLGLDNTRTIKYNIPKIGGVLCKDVSMELVESLQRVTSGTGLVMKWHTGENGESIMGQCPLDSLFTTLMGISKITTSQILPSLMSSLTNGSILGANCEMENGGSPAENAEISSTLDQGITSVHQELVLGVSRVVSEMLSVISDGANWKQATNTHSTVKPTPLMRYLCRLVTPPNGIILDPFAGSGSTGKAAILEGFRFIGIELEMESVEIAVKRLPQKGLPL
uniref:Putative methyltransferase n=1 Tax=viral metagenome TaxID=1070528 RepID=A0A6H2A215_9ZZZZ